jgi:hypothetical protein
MTDTSERDILKRLERLERAVFGDHSKKKPAKVGTATRNTALPAHIGKLKDQGFFASPRTAVEVCGKLQPTYHCDVNRVAMALLRLHKRKALRKTQKLVGKKRAIAYVW